MSLKAIFQDQTVPVYLRNWAENITHYISPSKDELIRLTSTQVWAPKVIHAISLALPFAPLLRPMTGRTISFILCGFNLVNSSSSGPIKTLEALKAGVELAATATGLKNGLLAHTVMKLVESLWSLRLTKKDNAWSPRLTTDKLNDELMNVASNALYLIALLPLSKQEKVVAMGASLAFQAFANIRSALIKAHEYQESWLEMKTLDIAVYSSLTLLFALKARSQFQEFRRLQYPVH